MRKTNKKRAVKFAAVFQITLMISLTFAFATIMSESVQAVDLVGSTSNTISGAVQNKYGAANTRIASISNPPSILPSNSIFNSVPASSMPSSTSFGSNVNFQLGSTGSSSTLSSSLLSSGPGAGTPQVTVLKTTPYKPVESQFFGKIETPIYGNLYNGLVWSVMVLGAIQLIGGLAGLDKGLTNSLSYAAVGGIMTGQLALGAMQQSSAASYGGNILNGGAKMFGVTQGQFAFGIGAAVAIAIFVATYKKTDTKRVQFQCMPWEAPSGGSRCEECNGDIFRPCTEYRCKSLGQACELLNPNTANAQCAWVSRNDVKSPTITPSNAALYPDGLKYEPDTQIRPPAIGSKIVTSSKGCLPAFTPLEFGFTTDEPAQCKIDYVHTDKFNDMQYYVGDSNYFEYNHTQKMRLPGPANETGASSLYIRNDGTMALYVRCRDANGNENKEGNENVDEYVFSFCVDKGPDTTPPVMEGFSLPSGSFVTYNQDNVPMDIYVNEPAQCKWSVQDKNYDDMENLMRCYNNPDQVNADLQYACTSNVTGVKNMQDNKYYFRCEDTAGNTNTNSKELVLKGSRPLNIIKVLPNETVTGSTEYVSVDLQVETSDGAEEGKALCYFSETGTTDSYIQMFETDAFMHRQTLSLKSGDYKYYFRCLDYGGNAAVNYTEFSVYSDKDSPRVTRVYKEDALKIVTDEDAKCSYSLSSCDFEMADGTEMMYSPADTAADIMYRLYAEWKSGQTYYIKCQDLYGNEPSPNECSLVVSSVELSKSEDNTD